MARCSLCSISKLLVLVGGINWGLVGLGYFLNMNLNVVTMLVGSWPTVEAIVYILVGLAAIAELLKVCKVCR